MKNQKINIEELSKKVEKLSLAKNDLKFIRGGQGNCKIRNCETHWNHWTGALVCYPKP